MTISVILFVFGAIIGSFLNVVGLRWDNKNFGGRSQCPSCKQILKWRELIPILSFFILKAKCAKCRAPISWQYLLIEIWTGLVFVTIFNLQLSVLQNLLFLTVFSIYIVITVYDSKHKIIPDGLVYTAIFLSVLVPLFFAPYSLLDWLSGPILFTFFASIWFLSGGRAMGFGDAKLSLSVGLLLGATTGFSAIVLSFWIGALGSIAYILLVKFGRSYSKNSYLKNAKGLTMKSEVPFAPAIILGAWIALIFHLDILHVSLF